ncbi:LytTR family DNA-binding domain-containing protein [Tenacibaculum ovolyticum]|uniref:LytTR family DNA-binding domain-containing protein n=1 Tax=Tenacibaculum ovolyticum TaxID=104270 RepID=UPI0022F39269|nr:LytTR family DNA-binding domain-containing protein [Tenacibaculum ovolyticum]WBX77155.1 LytTR family DNA-binding domain-containing protein [Tenacibaculum ovolyticum]
MSARNLKYYENILSEHTFVRIHQSHLINIKYIASVTTNTVVLIGGEKIPLASRKKELFKAVSKSISANTKQEVTIIKLFFKNYFFDIVLRYK